MICIGRACFEAGMDIQVWAVEITLHLRMKVFVVQVGPFYAQVSW